jgi:tRNA(Arg) A34 adenosine deaminase TadA
MNHSFMEEAIKLSLQKSLAGEGGPFGAVIVQGETIIGRGWNQVLINNDPTCHAEIVAIRDACRTLNDYSLKGCSIYISCEPCPMCLAAIYWAGINEIYYAATRKDAANLGFADDFIYHEISLPLAQRKIPMKQCLHDKALAVFANWEQLENKIIY